MSTHEHDHDLATEGNFDRVTLASDDGTFTTLQGDLPYRVNGFFWQFKTADYHRIGNPMHDEAIGVTDSENIARGYIADTRVDREDTQYVEIFVKPPA